jgi:hypothetical protein
MPLTLTDATAASQRLAVDNSGNTEFGSATPTAPLTFMGRMTMSGSNLAQELALSQAMPRTTGSVTLADSTTTAIVSVPGAAGFGSVDGDGEIFNTAGGNFQFFTRNSSSTTLGYSIF